MADEIRTILKLRDREASDEAVAGVVGIRKFTTLHATTFNRSDTLYQHIDDSLNKLMYTSIGEVRAIDLAEGLRFFEAKFDMPSRTFYQKWINDELPDSLEFNKWADNYSAVVYVSGDERDSEEEG